MSDDLDLSALTDDQLVGLARLVAAEAAQRKYGVQHAARAAVLDEEEKARIMSLATEAEWARIRGEERRRVEEEARAKVRAEAAAKEPRNSAQEAEWAQKKLFGRMVLETLGAGWTLNVWRSRENNEVRVYLDHQSVTEERSRYGSRKKGPHAVVYITGGSKNPPGKLEMSKISAPRKAVLAIANLAARQWREVRIDCDEAIEALVPDLPYPSEYLAAN